MNSRLNIEIDGYESLLLTLMIFASKIAIAINTTKRIEWHHRYGCTSVDCYFIKIININSVSKQLQYTV